MFSGLSAVGSLGGQRFTPSTPFSLEPKEQTVTLSRCYQDKKKIPGQTSLTEFMSVGWHSSWKPWNSAIPPCKKPYQSHHAEIPWKFLPDMAWYKSGKCPSFGMTHTQSKWKRKDSIAIDSVSQSKNVISYNIHNPLFNAGNLGCKSFSAFFKHKICEETHRKHVSPVFSHSPLVFWRGHGNGCPWPEKTFLHCHRREHHVWWDISGSILGTSALTSDLHPWWKVVLSW